MKLKFLGTGGGRYVTGEQRRNTGGIVIKTDETQVHVDPGPGALVHTHEMLEDPLETEAAILTHQHLDHANDIEPIIEMMTQAADKPGTLFTNETSLNGHGDLEKVVSEYHQDLLMRVENLGDDDSTEFKDLEIETQEMFHTDPHTLGFTVDDGEKRIGFWTDTEFSEDLIEFYEGCDTLVVFCSRPRNASARGHISLDEVPNILEPLDVSTCIVTHFGYRFLDTGVEQEKEWLEEQVDAKIIFAEDGMEFPGNRSLGDF
jgi:ribonuclease BN (tRNA processing enzyme)